MTIAYLAEIGDERAERAERIEKEGLEIITTNSTREADELLSQGHCNVLLYEWPYGAELIWIKKRFVTIERNPSVSFEAFLSELKQVIPNLSTRK